MRRLFPVLCAYLLILMGGQGMPVGAQEDEPVTVTVDASAIVGTISPYVLGVNHGPWSEVSLQMQENAQQINTPFLRYPGGNWGDQFNLTEAQIDLYMLQAQMWDAVPSIHVRLEGGTPEQAAALVRYANIEKGYDVRHWYIGNEPNLFDDYTIEQFNQDWRVFAEAMLAVDPDLILIGPEVSQFPDTTSPNDPNATLNDVWLRQFLEVNGDLVDIVGVHRYPFPLSFAGEPTSLSAMRENVPRWQTVVQNMRDTIDDVLGEPLPVALTEVNSHWSNSGGSIASPDSYYNAVWWSGVLTTLIHEEVDIITYFMFSTVGANGPFGLLDRYEPRPTYYTYRLYSEIGDNRLQSTSSDDYITALATQDSASGQVALIVTNLYEEDRAVQIDVSDLDLAAVNTMHILTPELMAEPVPASDYLTDNTLTLPAQSVVLLLFGDV
ncbi:MAG: GH39 family glycosyl hydrolase [Anaerolineae bacterium]